VGCLIGRLLRQRTARNDIVYGRNDFERARGGQRRIGQNASAGHAVRAVRADDDLRAKNSRVSFHRYAIGVGKHSLDRDSFSNLYSSILRISRQPEIKLVAADDADGVFLPQANFQPAAGEIKMSRLHIHMRNFAHIQPEAFENHFGIGDKSASAKLGAWIMLLFQNQDAGRELRVDSHQMQRGGESAWSAAEDEDIVLMFHELKQIIACGYKWLNLISPWLLAV